MKEISIGSYYPLPTYIHDLDARVKVVAGAMVIILLFLMSSFWGHMLIACFLLGLIFSARLPIRLLSGISSLRFVLFLTFILSVFMTPGEDVVLEWRWFYATTSGILDGVMLVIRVVLMLITTMILTSTTTVLTLTSALEFLLSPLRKLRMPIAQVALMINLALRFIPTIMSEKDRIINAQKACGASFEADGILKKAKSIIPVLIPLIISSFKRADDLALAMESRCFRIGAARTNYRVMQMRRDDYKALLIMLVFFVGMVAFEIFQRHIL